MRTSSITKILLSLPLLAVACGGEGERASTPPADPIATSYGGLTLEDEAPAFGDADLGNPAVSAADAPVVDPVLDARTPPADARRVRVLVAWGYLQPRPDAATEVDWSGSITAEHAVVRVLRRVRFEAESDLVLRPRDDAARVSFESTTRPHMDGLLLEVITAPALNPEKAPVTLTFASAPITDTLTLEPDMRGHKVVSVDDAGHVLAYALVRPDRDACREGMLRGEWRITPGQGDRPHGVLRGRWTSGDGELAGFVKGVFGRRENGKQVLFAKVADREGHFLGLLAGRYEDGRFAGRYLGRKDAQGRPEIRGRAHGRFEDRGDDGAGHFLGRWAVGCKEDPAEGTSAASDELDLGLDDEISAAR